MATETNQINDQNIINFNNMLLMLDLQSLNNADENNRSENLTTDRSVKSFNEDGVSKYSNNFNNFIDNQFDKSLEDPCKNSHNSTSTSGYGLSLSSDSSSSINTTHEASSISFSDTEHYASSTPNSTTTPQENKKLDTQIEATQNICNQNTFLQLQSHNDILNQISMKIQQSFLTGASSCINFSNQTPRNLEPSKKSLNDSSHRNNFLKNNSLNNSSLYLHSRKITRPNTNEFVYDPFNDYTGIDTVNQLQQNSNKSFVNMEVEPAIQPISTFNHDSEGNLFNESFQSGKSLINNALISDNNDLKYLNVNSTFGCFGQQSLNNLNKSTSYNSVACQKNNAILQTDMQYETPNNSISSPKDTRTPNYTVKETNKSNISIFENLQNENSFKKNSNKITFMSAPNNALLVASTNLEPALKESAIKYENEGLHDHDDDEVFTTNIESSAFNNDHVIRNQNQIVINNCSEDTFLLEMCKRLLTNSSFNCKEIVDENTGNVAKNTNLGSYNVDSLFNQSLFTQNSISNELKYRHHSLTNNRQMGNTSANCRVNNNIIGSNSPYSSNYGDVNEKKRAHPLNILSPIFNTLPSNFSSSQIIQQNNSSYRPTNNSSSLIRNFINNNSSLVNSQEFSVPASILQNGLIAQNSFKGNQISSNGKPLRSERLPSHIIEDIIKQAKLRRKGGGKKEVCVFCRNNGEKEQIYTSHTLKDAANRVSCPILRLYQCPICHASADNAHTIKYCPYSTTQLTSLTEKMQLGAQSENDNNSLKLAKENRLSSSSFLMSNTGSNNCPSPPLVQNLSQNSKSKLQHAQSTAALSRSLAPLNQTPLTSIQLWNWDTSTLIKSTNDSNKAVNQTTNSTISNQKAQNL